jgi:hypothetical protein
VLSVAVEDVPEKPTSGVGGLYRVIRDEKRPEEPHD